MSDPFEMLAKSLGVGPVTKPAHPSRPQRMNSNAFCVRNKLFAMRVGDELVLKLLPKRVAELIAARVSVPHVVGGRPTTEWARLSPTKATKWLDLAKESLDYVRSKR